MDNQKTKNTTQNKEDVVAVVSALQGDARNMLNQIKKAIGNSLNLKKSLLSNQNMIKAQKVEAENAKLKEETQVVEKVAKKEEQPQSVEKTGR